MSYMEKIPYSMDRGYLPSLRSPEEVAALEARCQELEIALETAIASEISCRVFRKPLGHCTDEEHKAVMGDAIGHLDEYMTNAKDHANRHLQMEEIVKAVSELPDWPGADHYIKVRNMAREATKRGD